MPSYRFCRTDDIDLLVRALNRCWAPHVPGEPLMTAAAFKRSIRDLQVWCSSCMVAFADGDPIAVLIGAKRPSATLVHRIAVHPDHLRQGHGRHLLSSLGSKLAILGPPRIEAEVPDGLTAARALFAAAGYAEDGILTDYVLSAGQEDQRPAIPGRLVIPVTIDDLDANGLLEPGNPACPAAARSARGGEPRNPACPAAARSARGGEPGNPEPRNPEPGNPEPGTREPRTPERGTRNAEPGTRNPEPGTRNPGAPCCFCWERSVETLMARKEEIAGLAVASDEGIEAYVMFLKPVDDGPAEILRLRALAEKDDGKGLALLLSIAREQGIESFRFPRVNPAEISTGTLEALGFRPSGSYRRFVMTAGA